MSWFARGALAALLAFGVSACGDGGSAEPGLWARIRTGVGSDIWPRAGYDVVSDGKQSQVFRTGVAILKVPSGVDPVAHAKSQGFVPIARLSESPAPRIATEDRKLASALERRRRKLPTKSTSRVLLVKLPLDRAKPESLLPYLGKKGWAGKSPNTTSDAGYRTLASVAAHQQRFEAEGYSLTLNVGRVPYGLIEGTDEGAGLDALADDYAAITNLRRAWMLAQIAETPFSDPVQGFADGTTVAGPPILGIVDEGFATSVADFSPDIVFPPEAAIGGAGLSGFHGTGVTSVAMSPINNGIRGAGSCPYSRGSVLPTFSATARVALLWSDAPEPDNWSGAQGVVGALAGGSDVVNMSWGTDCNFWCRNFGSASGWNVLSEALQLGEELGVAMIAAAGNDEVNLSEKYVIPCEMADGRPVCVGAIDRNENNVGNFGSGVHVWAPGHQVRVSPDPESATGTFGGTSAAAPFIAGLVAAAVGMRGSGISTGKARTALEETARASSDDRAPRIVDAYGFFRRFARVRADAHEPSGFTNISWATPATILQETLSISEPAYYANDEDYLAIDGVTKCSDLMIGIRYLDDSDLGDLEANYLYGAASYSVTRPGPDRLLVAGTRVASLTHPGGGRTFLGLRASGSLTTGYWLESMTVTPPAFATEGTSLPATCNGIDDDCDGKVDEEFPDSDHDGQADCVDLDDDHDCIADTADNCPNVRNADPYCPGVAALAECRSRCPHLRAPPFKPALETLLMYIGETRLPPECWIDGCPVPEIMHDPTIVGTLRDIQLGRFDLGPDVRAMAFQFDLSRPGVVRFGPGVPSKPGRGLPEFVPRRSVAHLFRPSLESIEAKCTEWAATQDCQKDSDSDGVGDACEP